jgi:mersacidin/lichenicidin family type 2 lantibiotic
LYDQEQEKGNIPMSNIAQAWKEEANCGSLLVEEQAMLPADAAGVFELTDEHLKAVYGAGGNAQTSGFGLAAVVESLFGGMTGKG